MARILWIVLLFAACSLGEQKITDYCSQELDNCPPCARDTECVIVSNACHEFGTCTHRDTDLVVTSDGCLLGYDVPSDDVCQCVAEMCATPD